MKDYYKTLGIKPDCDIDDIKKAYRSLSLKYHPDKNSSSDAADKFIEITEAYEVLSDKARREKYDKKYRKEHSKSDRDFSLDVSFEEEYTRWEKEGRAKANRDANMPYEKFAKQVAREVKLGVSYIPNLVAMLISGGSAIFCLGLSLSAADDLGAGGSLMMLLTAIGLMGVTYKLFTVAKSDFQKDRSIYSS